MQNVKKFLREHWIFLAIVVIVTSFFLLHLGRDQLWDWDECIYSTYAREMKTSGDYLTNQWNGKLGFEKPPLYGILLQVPYAFGINEFNGRILSVIFSIAIAVLVYMICLKLFSKRTGILATLILFASEAFVIYSVRVSTDPGYVLFILGAVYAWILSFKKPQFALLSGLLFGLAVMIKGLSVASFLMVVFVSIFLPYSKEKLINFIKLIGIFLVVIAPWHIYQFMVHGKEFTYVYLYENLIKRANNPIEFHLTGKLFYVKQLGKEFFPWIGALILIPIYYVLHRDLILKKKELFKEIQKKEVLIVISLCILIPFIILTRAQTRLQWYALPLYPFLAILIGYLIDQFFMRVTFKGSKILFYVIAAVLCFDAGKLIYSETRVLDFVRQTTPRNNAFVAARKYPDKEVTYLTPYSERRGREVLPESMTTTTTFIYGGTTCSVYYSEKSTGSTKRG